MADLLSEEIRAAITQSIQEGGGVPEGLGSRLTKIILTESTPLDTARSIQSLAAALCVTMSTLHEAGLESIWPAMAKAMAETELKNPD